VSAGYPITAAEVNAKTGALVTSLWDDLEALNRWYRWLTDASHNDAFLNGIGITVAGDITALRAGVSDLGSHTNGLHAVAHGVIGTAQNNFFFNARALTGTNYTG
jgi:hypothetical protein